MSSSSQPLIEALVARDEGPAAEVLARAFRDNDNGGGGGTKLSPVFVAVYAASSALWVAYHVRRRTQAGLVFSVTYALGWLVLGGVLLRNARRRRPGRTPSPPPAQPTGRRHMVSSVL